MLEYSDIRVGKIILYEDEPCLVLENHVARTQQRKPQNQTKLRSLLSGRAYTATFHASDKAEEAEIAKRDVKFLYSKGNEFWFCDPTNPANRFKLDEKLLGNAVKYLKANENATALIWGEDEDEKIISVQVPVKMTFVVKDAPPSIKGASASGSGKQVTLENGIILTVPMFINAGEKIIVNTETGDYVERA